MITARAAGTTVSLADGVEASGVAERVREGLARYNEPKAGPRRTLALTLSLKDERGDLIGGLIGKTYWNALHIELLWVAEEFRGSGGGRQLVEAAEREALGRGAKVAYVTTISFQAPNAL